MSGLQEVPEEIWKELKPWQPDEAMVQELTQKFWDDIPEEARIRLRELKRKIWEWLRQRDMEFREFQDARILDFLHSQKRRSDRKHFARYVKTFGARLAMKYAKIILVEEENFRAAYYGLLKVTGYDKERRTSERWERVNTKDIIVRRNINIKGSKYAEQGNKVRSSK